MTGFVLLAGGILFLLSMASFHPQDPSWNTVAGPVRTNNLVGPVGAHLADLFLQAFGLAAFLLPLLIFALGWKWIRSEAVEAPTIKLLGSTAMVLSACGAAALLPPWRVFEHSILVGGAAGFLVAGSLIRALNPIGAAVVLATSLVVSVYLVSTFTLAKLSIWFRPLINVFTRMRENWRRSLERRREAALEKHEAKRQAAQARALELQRIQYEEATTALPTPDPAITQRTMRRRDPEPVSETLPWDDPPETNRDIQNTAPPAPDEIPICQLAETVPPPGNIVEFPFNAPTRKEPAAKPHTIYRLPST
ncbi:MAG: DNA translocase FtsK 4TM domain-containing protein, partial [Acidobacteriota bacterium]|nr:DNA translocase FtsK 4TM domain-containing protein [Acidobacteriota bacterium]